MNEYKQNAINHLKTHLDCVGYRDYLVAELEKLDKIEQIMNASSYTENGKEYSYCYDNDTRVKHIREVLENE